MGKNDPTKGNADDYAKKAQKKRGVQDPLSDIDTGLDTDMDDGRLQNPRNPKGPQRGSRGQKPMDEPAEEHGDI